MITVTKDIQYIGVDDHQLDLFEGQYAVPLGMAYNSYVILDQRVAVMDTVDRNFTDQWLGQLEAALAGRRPDYLVVQHMEPDHSASIRQFLETYPETTVVASQKAFAMLDQFYPMDPAPAKMPVKTGDSLALGTHTLTFYQAPMVHWPEVMVSYDSADKVLFSADAFGKFGANDVVDPEGWDCEARRYYFGIVGKYGGQVQRLLKSLAGLDIQTICPLHGPVLKEDLGHYLNLYGTWSSYEPEDRGVLIAYTSVYGHTRAAAEHLANALRALGCPAVEITDLAREDMAEAVENAFRYDHLVLATTTYNGDVFPFMRTFIDHLTERNYQKHTVAFVENGSWAPMAAKVMGRLLADSRDLTFTEPVTIRSAMTDADRAALDDLASSLWAAPEPAAAEDVPAADQPLKRWVCTICGYIYEGAELPADFICPLCHQDVSVFEPLAD